MQWWTNAVDYPMNISGKPLFSLPANIPVAFELIILFSALTAFAGVLMLNCLPALQQSAVGNGAIPPSHQRSVLRGRRCGRPGVQSATRCANLLQSAGATAVEEVLGPSRPASIPLAVHLAGIVALCVALIPAVDDCQGPPHHVGNTPHASGPRHG